MNGMKKNIPLPMMYPKITIGFLRLILSVMHPAKAVAGSAGQHKSGHEKTELKRAYVGLNRSGDELWQFL